jgi:hypothetical protein
MHPAFLTLLCCAGAETTDADCTVPWPPQSIGSLRKANSGTRGRSSTGIRGW